MAYITSKYSRYNSRLNQDQPVQHCIVYHQSNCTVSVDISFWMQFAALISSCDTMRVMVISHCISRFTAAYHGLPLHITVWRNTHCLNISFTFKSPHWQYHSIFLTHGLPEISLFKYILLYSNKFQLATPPLFSSSTPLNVHNRSHS